MSLLSAEGLAFVAERHLAVLSTFGPDGSIHAVPVGFTFDPEDDTLRIITGGPTRKAWNVRRAGSASVCQVDGARWLTLDGPTVVDDDPDAVADAVRRYAERYRQPRPNPERVVLRMHVRRVLASTGIRNPQQPAAL
ncbi:TIGR03618 family F420-dependent PPOX class oxidoreductase [Microbacteriaceae bacterium VKM Ac-2855]|nr:TIGR03618 family F420-dependent PPOX class oxidoreductase [Microbacteriaceae bacterium VKM Ac-2855]